MSWNAHNFCGGLEGMIQSAFASAANARSADRDDSGWDAINRLAGALRAERRRTTRLKAELEATTRALEEAREALRQRPRATTANRRP